MQPPDFSSMAPYLAWYARRTPTSTAIVEGALQVNYRTMAADLARCILALQDHGVASGMLVGVEARRQRYLHLLVLLACEVIGATTTSFSQQHLHGDDLVLRHCNVLLLAASLADHYSANLTIPSDWLESLPAMPLNQDAIGLLRQDSAADSTTRIVRTLRHDGSTEIDCRITSHAAARRQRASGFGTDNDPREPEIPVLLQSRG